MVVCGRGEEKIVQIREMSKAFKIAAFFQLASMICIWAIITFNGGENQALIVPLAWTSVGAQILAAFAAFVGLSDENLKQYRRF